MQPQWHWNKTRLKACDCLVSSTSITIFFCRCSQREWLICSDFSHCSCVQFCFKVSWNVRHLSKRDSIRMRAWHFTHWKLNYIVQLQIWITHAAKTVCMLCPWNRYFVKWTCVWKKITTYKKFSGAYLIRKGEIMRKSFICRCNLSGSNGWLLL